MDSKEIDELVESPNETAGTPEEVIDDGNVIAEEQPATAESKAETPKADEKPKEEESFLLPAGGNVDDEFTDEGGEPSPKQPDIIAHVAGKYRQKIRELKAENEQLRQQQKSRPDGEQSEAVNVDELLNDVADDEYITKDKLAKIVKAVVSATTQQVKQNVKTEIEAENNQMSKAAFADLCNRSESHARKHIADYADVMSFAKDFNLINNADRQTAMSSKHPAKALYDIAKGKIARLNSISAGTSPTNKSNETRQPKPPQDVSQDEILSDDEFFDKLLA
jgi:hypothetical protein